MPYRLFVRNRPHQRWRYRLCTAVLLTLVGACAGPPERSVDPALYADTGARALSSNGEHGAAALEYLRIAELAPSPDAEEYRLAAANAYLAISDSAHARAALGHSSLDGASEPVRLRRSFLMSRVQLIEGDSEAALLTLRAINFDNIAPYLAREGLQVRADALARNGDYRGAARQRVALELVLTQPEEISENRGELWHSLAALSDEELESMRRRPPDTLGGWVELARLRGQYLTDAASLESALGQWTKAFPHHPGKLVVAPRLLAESRAASKPATHIALLLPLSGQFEDAANAVRDGFFASWFASDGAAARPKISVYDTSNRDAAAVHAQAVAAGADFVVGPLRKDAVAAVHASNPSVPTLALNAVSGAGHEEGALYQFALSPEGEAEQVAEKAWFDGHVQALVLAPDSGWGSRVSSAFQQRWSALGGSVSDAKSYGTDPNALATTVRTLLNVDQSEKRAAQLQNILGVKLEYEPRRRQDVDVIFLAGFPRQARQLRPQIDFYRASRVPVYATSHVYSGKRNPNADGDVNGIIFGDMPWVLSSVATRDGLRERMFALWSGATGSFTRFYAFGADAHQLVGAIRQLRARPATVIEGHTGGLSLRSGNRVTRRLEWAIFDDGVPKPLTAPDG